MKTISLSVILLYSSIIMQAQNLLGTLVLSDLVSGTLPLTLIDFTAANQDKIVHLAWQTTQEINSDYFEIERSIDGTNFSKIGIVTAKGNNSSLANYSCTDNALPYLNVQRQILEYRLKMIDKDGQFTYSKVVAVKFTAPSSIKIYPSPVKNILQIEGLNSSAPSIISIIDFSGNIVRKAIVENNNYLCDVNNLSCGIYYIRIIENKKITSLKFNKGIIIYTNLTGKGSTKFQQLSMKTLFLSM